MSDRKIQATPQQLAKMVANYHEERCRCELEGYCPWCQRYESVYRPLADSVAGKPMTAAGVVRL